MGLFDFLKNKNKNENINEINNENSEDNYDYEDEDFEMVVEDVFSITGRGTVVTGEVTSGIIYIGEEVYINDEISTEVVRS